MSDTIVLVVQIRKHARAIMPKIAIRMHVEAPLIFATSVGSKRHVYVAKRRHLKWHADSKYLPPKLNDMCFLGCLSLCLSFITPQYLT